MSWRKIDIFLRKTPMRLFLLTVFLFACYSASSQHADNTEGIKHINGTGIYVKTLGQGEPVLFIHGGPGLSHDYFLPHVEALSKNLQIIFYDQRGCGRSSVDLDPKDMTLAHFTDDIRLLLDDLGIGQVHLLAHSFGGLLAMDFATRFPGRVRSLILCNSVAASKEFDQLSAERQQQAMTESDHAARAAIFASEGIKGGDPKAYEQLFKIGFKRSFFDTLLIDKLEMNLNANFAKTSKLLYGLSPDLVTYDYHPKLSQLQVPALVIHGAADLVPEEAGKKIASVLPKSRYQVFENSGHFPFIEQKDEFIKVVTEFVGQASQTKK